MTDEEKAAKAKEEAEEKAKRAAKAEVKAKREAEEKARREDEEEEIDEEEEREAELKSRRRKRAPAPEPEDYGEDVRELDKRVSRIETAREKRQARAIGAAATVTAVLLLLGVVGLQIVKRLRSTSPEGSDHGTENPGLRWDS